MQIPKIRQGLFILFFAAIWSGCAVHKIEGAKARAVPLAEAAVPTATALQEWASGKTDTMVLLVRAGESVKLHLGGDFGFAKIEAKDNSVQFLEDTYFYISKKEGFLISPDGVRFAPIHKGRAVKKLFGKRRGTFHMGVGLSKEEGPFINMGAGLE